MVTPIRKPGRKKKAPRKRADELFSRFVRLRDGACVVPGCTSVDLQAAHVVSRRYAVTRFDPENCWALCRGHHHFFTVRPLEWEEFVEERIGAEAYLNLKKKARAGGKVNYPALLGWLNEAIRTLEAEA